MSTRKSTRLSAKAEAAAVAATQLPPNEQLKLVNVKKTTKKAQGSRNLKKQKISDEKVASNRNATDQSNRSRVKGKNANSKFLRDVPVDILLEIFRRLEPIDLLHLSRVSKSLHDLLASNDVTFLWKLTYKNIGEDYQPPSCPEETNIVFYTNYLYGRHCQVCSSRNGRIYHDAALIRLCSKCADNSLLLDKTDPTISKLCNKWALPQYKHGSVILRAEYSLRLEEFKHAQKDKKVKSYVTERESVVHNRHSFACGLDQWRKRIHNIQINERAVLRYTREAAIMRKLEKEGCNIDTMWYQLQRAPHVRRSQQLTDSEWPLIRADILEFFQDLVENRAREDMRNRLERRISRLQSFIHRWRIHPTAWWIAASEPLIASIIKDKISEELPTAVFEKLELQLQDVIMSWKEETDCYLATLIPQPSGKGKQKDYALELAATFFKCYWCTEPISYPRILMHGCLLKDVKSREEVGDEDEEDVEDPERDAVVWGSRAPRPPKEITAELVFSTLSDTHGLGMYVRKEGVTYDEEASTAARDIIAACGEDPMTVTNTAMEKENVRLECLRCSRVLQAKPKAKSVRLVMSWTMALVHELDEHYGEPPASEPAWRRIDSVADLAKVEDAETKTQKLKRNQKSFSCNYCSYVVLPAYLPRHLTQTHKISVISPVSRHVSEHYGIPVDTPIKKLYPAVKI